MTNYNVLRSIPMSALRNIASKILLANILVDLW